jgi:hypothetical protein
LIDSLCIEKGWPTPVTRGQQLGKDVLSEFQTLHADYKAKTTERRKVADKVVKAAPVIVKCRMAALAQADSHAELAPEDKSVAAKIARVIDQLFRAGNQKVIKELTGKPTKEETPMLGQQDTQLKKFWVEDPHLLKEAEPIRLPDLSQDVGLHASKFWRDALRCAAPRHCHRHSRRRAVRLPRHAVCPFTRHRRDYAGEAYKRLRSNPARQRHERKAKRKQRGQTPATRYT